jgi:hypothetical protein
LLLGLLPAGSTGFDPVMQAAQEVLQFKTVGEKGIFC